jgi:hypothetical protein
MGFSLDVASCLYPCYIKASKVWWELLLVFVTSCDVAYVYLRMRRHGTSGVTACSGTAFHDPPILFKKSLHALCCTSCRLRGLKGWRDRKELSRQIRFRLLQMQQMNRRQQRTSDLLCKATRAGGKLQLAQPRTATRVRPSVQPPVGHRCVVLLLLRCYCVAVLQAGRCS